jgi:glucokinase
MRHNKVGRFALQETCVLTIGLDIGGTKIAGAVVDEQGTIVRQLSVPTPATDAAALEDAIVAMIQDLASDGNISAAGIAAAGFIDASQSTVYYAPNISWRNHPLRANVEARTGLTVVVENDANAAGWAEYRFGAGRLFTHVVMLTVGTGVGGAIIVDGRLFRGGFGVGAELGHITVQPDGLLCGCGRYGCIEQYGSGRALLRFAEEESRKPGTGDALAAARDADGNLPPAAVKSLLEQGDPGALAALTTLGTWLGKAAASLDAVLDPEIFVIGGGVASAGEHLVNPNREAFLANMSARGFRPEPEFRIAEMLNDAGVIGAADLARIHLDESLPRAQR